MPRSYVLMIVIKSREKNNQSQYQWGKNDLLLWAEILFGIQPASFGEFCCCLLLWQHSIGEGETNLVEC